MFLSSLSILRTLASPSSLRLLAACELFLVTLLVNNTAFAAIPDPCDGHSITKDGQVHMRFYSQDQFIGFVGLHVGEALETLKKIAPDEVALGIGRKEVGIVWSECPTQKKNFERVFELNHSGAFADAIIEADKILKNWPLHGGAASEKVFSLMQLRRFAEAKGVIAGILEYVKIVDQKLAAKFYRNLAYMAFEEKSWSEAKKLHYEALKLDPGNKTSLVELKLISKLEARGR